jgi:HK97 family phage portal protein
VRPFAQIGRFLAKPFTRKSDPERSTRISVPLRQAGEMVTHDTAFKFSAFYRGVAYISETIGCLPWEVIRETDTTTRKMVNHPAWNLLKKRPNPEMSAKTWRQTMVAWAISWGNGYSEIECNLAGQPVALWPISPDRVKVRRDAETLEIYYEVDNYVGGTSIIQPENMFHLRGLGFDGLTGSWPWRDMGPTFSPTEP